MTLNSIKGLLADIRTFHVTEDEAAGMIAKAFARSEAEKEALVVEIARLEGEIGKMEEEAGLVPDR